MTETDSPTDAAVDQELARTLRAHGLRLTQPRSAILQAVRELGHATPEQLADAVPGADLTTVYRTLELFESLGLVSHAHLGHGAPSYRPAGDRHVHVVCHHCGSVSDVEPGVAVPLAEALRTTRGFELDLAHFTVFGRCATCQAEDGTREQTEPMQR